MSDDLPIYLEGRRLLLEELPFSPDVIDSYQQFLHIEQALLINRNRYQCVRCGNKNPDLFAETPCVRCQQGCIYCRKCVQMGKVCQCSSLISWTGPIIRRYCDTSLLEWEGTLSEGQSLASSAVKHAIKKKESCLIWAVCGAGKTEVLFAGIDAALQRGDRVCIATPRTDVVLELFPRLQKVFPSVSVTALYGGSPNQRKSSPLIITTTHQLLRFYHAFDTVIVDEVDAFPYSVDSSLQHAVMQAKTKEASLIYLTATPSEKMKREVRKGMQKAVVIPARYHRHPLPVPSFKWCGNWKGKIGRNTLPSSVMNWIISHLSASHPVFLFVSRISYIAPIVSLLQTVNKQIEGVHSKDPARKEKVISFRNGDIPLLVTTTILERGVTVTNLQVGVLGAEEEIFTESALVQIAGRAGRHANFPRGDVLFFHFGKTEAMVAARNHISSMNKRAIQMGWIT